MRAAARGLRLGQTEAEAMLWQALRGGGVDGLKFRRQHAVASFVVDFYCPERHLAVEVDGGIHDEPAQQIRDATKQEYLQALGNTALRLHNEDITHDLSTVLERIHLATATSKATAPPEGQRSDPPNIHHQHSIRAMNDRVGSPFPPWQGERGSGG
jgi:very-short-patch-repair endonuclease